MNKLATITILDILDKDTRTLTHHHTPYMYVNLRVDYMAQYFSKTEVKYTDSFTMKDIQISKTNYELTLVGTIFIILLEQSENSREFINFAKKLDHPTVQMYSQDRFLIDYQKELKVLSISMQDGTGNDDNRKDDLSLAPQYFLSKFSKDQNFIDDLNYRFENNKLYYDIYDVNGFFSVVTDDEGFDFYIDMGDTSNNSLPVNANPHCVFISHYHHDHYNILIKSKIKPQNYILPYSGSILYNGVQHFPANEIRLLMGSSSNTHLIFMEKSPRKGRNKLKKYKFTNKVNLYVPEHTNPNNRNLESICFEIKTSNNHIFYPGDTKNYMYYPFLQQYDWFIASHHGGDVGSLNLKAHVFDNLLVNTFHKNFNLYFSKYRTKYLNHAGNLLEGLNNNGIKICRISL